MFLLKALKIKQIACYDVLKIPGNQIKCNYSNQKMTKNLNIFISFVFLLITVKLSHSQEYIRIKAKDGEGIYSILKKHELSPAQYMDQFIELNKTKLGKNNTLISGQTYILPIKSSSAGTDINNNSSVSNNKIVFEIFGIKYKEVTIKSNILNGAIYYLLSGHGGPDPGAVGVLNGHKLCEDEYAYDVTLRLARNLIENGATVYMIIRDPNDGIRDDQFLIPDKDEICFPHQAIPHGQIARLKQSTDVINEIYKKNRGKFQRLVTIHVDSRSKKQNIDVFFYHDQRSNTGRKMAHTLMNTFDQKYAKHQPGRGYGGSVSDRNLYVIKNSFPPAVFIELGNINHIRDQKRLIIADNRQAVANWLKEGLIEDFKNNK